MSKKTLESALNQIKKAYIQGPVMKLGKVELEDTIEAIPDALLSLGIVLEVSGYPKVRVTELFRLKSFDKITLSFHVITECQKQVVTCSFVDAEYSFNNIYIMKLSMNVDNLLLFQSDLDQQVLEIADWKVNLDILHEICSWYFCNDEKNCQYQQNTKQHLLWN